MVSEVIGQCPGLIDQSLKTVNKFDSLVHSVGADSSSENAEGNHGGKGHGLLHQNAGSD